MKTILTTTATFVKAIEESDLKDLLSSNNTKVFLIEKLKEPFSFDPNSVLGLVAGHSPSGLMLKISSSVKKLFPNLKVVSPFGIGMNHIDIGGLQKSGVAVITLPHLSKRTVAELAIAFMFDLARRVTAQSLAMKNGIWERKDGLLVNGKQLGVIGLGNIGKEVAKMGRAIGMKVLTHDIFYDEDFCKEYEIEKANLPDLLSKSDVITLHLPFIDNKQSNNANIINQKAFSLMKKGVLFINTARGQLVDERALLEAIESGRVAGAALDVFSVEPPFKNEVLKRLIAHSNVIVTPHIAAFTPETRYMIAKKIYEEMLVYI